MNRNDGAVGDARKRGEALHSAEKDACPCGCGCGNHAVNGRQVCTTCWYQECVTPPGEQR